MVYQDHLTKFCILRAISSKRAVEVAHQLMDIFLLLGAPAILQSDNGSEFTSQIITELKEVWPALKLVHGQPRHPQSQGSVERANRDIKDMLTAWLADNNTTDWTVGIKFVQFHKNSALHAGIKRSPYEALFGCTAKVGLTSSALPDEIVERLETEDDLLQLNNPTEDPPQEDSIHIHPLDDSTVIPPAEDSTHTPPAEDSTYTPLPEDSTVTSPAEDSTHTPPVEDSVHATPDSDATTPAEDSNSTSPATPPPHLLPVQDTILHTPSSIPSSAPHLSPIASTMTSIRSQRNEAFQAQCQQADCMIKRQRIQLETAKEGNTVAVSIPSVDRGRGDPRNILGVITHHDEINDNYKIAVKAGVLKGVYSRSQFDVCPQSLLSVSQLNTDTEVSLRTAVSSESKCGGQGFQKCNCGPKQCKNNRCKCFKFKVKCNSRCHSSLSCANK